MTKRRMMDVGDVPDTGIPAELAVGMTMAEQYEWHQSWLSRHPVSRRNFLGGAAVAGAVGALGMSAAACSSYLPDAPLAVLNRRVGYGPDAASQIRLAAQLSRNPGSAKIFLDHGPTPDLGATVEAEIRNLVTQIPISTGGILGTEQFYAHVPVDNLPGHSKHFYRWRTEGFTTDVRSVLTAMAGTRSAMGPFRFTMMGDQGTDEAPSQPPGLAPGDYDNRTYKPDNDPGAPHTANVLRQIILSKPDFHLLAGDIAYADQTGLGRPETFVPSGNKAAEGLDKFNPFVWDVYLGAIEASASTTPWMFTTGNHDMESAYPMNGYAGHVARLDFPGNGPPACPSVYSFVHGNVAVLSLDSNDVSYEIKANQGYSGGSQNAWVERTLAAHRTNPDIDFIVCFFHHCAYSTSEQRASDGGLRAAWAGLFDRYQVDLALQAHNHVFERTDPIRAGSPTKAAPDYSVVYPATDGTVYYTVGGGGKPRYKFLEGEPESYRGHEAPDGIVPNSYVWTATGDKQNEAVGWSRVRFRDYSFVRVDVRPGTLVSEMDVAAVDEYGREFDKVTYRRNVTIG